MVAAEIAEKCTIQLAYIIGVAEPISIFLDTHGTGKVEAQKLIKNIKEIFDLKPSGIRKMLNLANPIYEKTATLVILEEKVMKMVILHGKNLIKLAN